MLMNNMSINYNINKINILVSNVMGTGSRMGSLIKENAEIAQEETNIYINVQDDKYGIFHQQE